MLFASAVGNWIDRSPSRLPSLLVTISLNHAAIIASYFCWLYWPVVAGQSDEPNASQAGPFSNLSKGFLYGFILLLDVVHDLSAIANRLSVERDWIPTMVGEITPEITYDLTQVNSVFIRIEHIVKLVAPSLLPLIMASFKIRAGWILLLIGVTILLWIAEVWFARKIAAENPELRAAKKPSHDLATMEDRTIEDRLSHLTPGMKSWPKTVYFALYQEPALRLKHFFSIRMWPASMSVSLLQLTVLAYSATLITYLLQVGFSLSLITIAKATGSITGLASTFITPMAVRYMRRRQARRDLRAEFNHEDEDENEDHSEGKIVRTVGMWGIASQFLCLVSKLVFDDCVTRGLLIHQDPCRFRPLESLSYNSRRPICSCLNPAPRSHHSLHIPLSLSHRPYRYSTHGSRTRSSRDPSFSKVNFRRHRTIIPFHGRVVSLGCNSGMESSGTVLLPSTWKLVICGTQHMHLCYLGSTSSL